MPPACWHVRRRRPPPFGPGVFGDDVDPGNGSTTQAYRHIRGGTTSAVDHPLSKIARGHWGYKGLRRCDCDTGGRRCRYYRGAERAISSRDRAHAATSINCPGRGGCWSNSPLPVQ
jgi:hypothetical protein